MQMGRGTYIGPVARGVPFDNLTNGWAALNTQTAIEESVIMPLIGAGTDGDLAMSSGTLTLSRTMYYNSVTLTGTAQINMNGFKIFCKNTFTIGDTAFVHANGAAGGNASGGTAGAASVGTNGFEVGAGQAGTIGATATNDSTTPATTIGYGGNGGTGGTAGGNAAGMGTGGVVTYRPEHVISMFHRSDQDSLKTGGGGGSGGNGGVQPLFTTGGAGGGGGAGAGVVFIIARTFANTSTNPNGGVQARGGNGGNGGNSSGGNSGGGGGGAGGGGGMIYIICLDALFGTVSVAGGNGGTGGTGAGSGGAGGTGVAGSTGHYALYSGRTSTWTVL